jgi:hypothetical protein
MAAALLDRYPRPLVTDTLRAVLEDARMAIVTLAWCRERKRC